MSSHCLWCGESISRQISWSHIVLFQGFKTQVCSNCLAKLVPISETMCPTCGRDLQLIDSNYISNDGRCLDCCRWEEGAWKGVLKLNRSLFTYNDFLRTLIARYKFRGDVLLVEGFRREWQRLYEQNFSDIDVIIPMPLSGERLYERSFNQSERLASLLNRPLTEILRRLQHEDKQSKKNREERLARVISPFDINPNDQHAIKNKTVLVIDDIYTTGATLRWAAHTLKQYGASEVVAMTLAHG